MTGQAGFHGDRSGGTVPLSALIYCKALLFWGNGGSRAASARGIFDETHKTYKREVVNFPH